MKSIGKAAGELVSKAVGALRRKAGVLLFLASPRRRSAVLAGISRHIRALTQPCQEKAAAAQRQHYCRDSRPTLAPADDDEDGGDVVVPFCFPHQLPASSLLLVVQAVDDGDGDGGCTAGSDWTLALRSLFDDDEGGGDHCGGDDCLAAAMDGLDDDEDKSVIDVIRRRREGNGQEFRIEDEIDRAADLYITRVRRRRMSAQLEELITVSC